MKLKNLYRFTILAAGLLLIVAGCVTQKRRGEEQSKFKQFYHNMTSEYNGYFNANELVKESTRKLEEQHHDNYTQILPIYKYLAADNPKAEAADLDKAIKKVALVRKLHTESNWVDDCYLLMGQAQFLKQDFESAEETFEYFSKEFDPIKMAKKKAKAKKKKKKKSSKEKKKEVKEKKKKREKERKKTAKQRRKEYNKKMKKRKKERAKNKKKKKSKKDSDKKKTTEEKKTEKPEVKPEKPKPKKKTEKEEIVKVPEQPSSYFLKHRPAYQEGILWMAKTYVERESYLRAEQLFTALENDPRTFDYIQYDLARSHARFFTKQKRYDEAIPFLLKAIDDAPKKKDKARLAFIVAQIHQKAGRSNEADKFFKATLKYRPSYEMEFVSRLNLVKNGYKSKSQSKEKTIAVLNKMLKDVKNDDYQDKIYYTLAEISLEDNNRKEAIANLRKALQAGKQDQAQKAEAYLLLANLYYEDENFVPAKNYFDSTIIVLSKSDDRYFRAENLSKNLTEIAKNIEIINFQDSMLLVSRMSDEEKRALAVKLKKKEDEAKLAALLKKKSDGKTDKYGKGSMAISPGQPGIPGFGRNTSSFFAYNENDVRKGARDFKKIWGDRKLEDNWRRSQRQSFNEVEIEDLEDTANAAITDEDVKRLLKGVPSSQKEVAAAEKKIEDAMFALGKLYRDKLENNKKSVETLEQLLKRFPKTDHRLDAWYYLYLAHTDMGHRDAAKKYYDLIVKQYPDSTYGRILKDPNYAKVLFDKEHRLNEYYDQTYALFQAGQHQKVLSKIKGVEKEFGKKNKLQPRFVLLQAMSTGNIKGKDAYVKALKELIAKYPNTDEKKRAKEILRLLGVETATAPIDLAKNKNGNITYKVSPESVHYITVIFKGDIDLNKAKSDISKFNTTYYNLKKLRLSNIFLNVKKGEKIPVIVMRRFSNKTKAMDYYDTVMKNKDKFLGKEFKDYEIYAVTNSNYRKFLKNKSTAGYKAFFEINYLK